MSKLSLYERPVHCTDTKRETLYIKDNKLYCANVGDSRESFKDALYASVLGFPRYHEYSPE